MKKIVTYMLLFIMLGIVEIFFAQSKTIDSLKQVLKTNKEDTTKVKTLCAISWQMIKNSQYDSALLYAGKALQLTDTIQVGTMHGWAKGKALAYNHMGVVYRNKGNYAKAL